MDDWELAVRPEGVPTVTTLRADPHDPSLDPPPSFDMDAERWQAFGSIDQRRLHGLASTFGSWADGAAATIAVAERDAAPARVRDLVVRAFHDHLADEGGPEVQDGALHFRHVRAGATASDVAAAEQLIERLAFVAQWDLYHLVAAPDIAVFHGGRTSLAERRERIAGGYRLFAGYSWTPDVDAAAGYGPILYATALPIRHVQLSWRVPCVPEAEAQVAKRELAPRHGLVLAPENSFAFDRDAADGAIRAELGRFGEGAVRPGSALARLRDVAG
jgi:hypothetical protein